MTRAPSAPRPIVMLLYAFAALSVLPMGFSTGLVAALGLAWALDHARRRGRRPDVPSDTLLFVAIYAWKAVTRAVRGGLSDLAWFRGIWTRLPYPMIGSYALDKRHALRILHVVFAANALVVLYALGQRYLGLPVIYKPLFFTGGYRLRGFFGHANQYAGCVSLVLLVNVCVAVYADRRALVSTPLLTVGLVLSASRSYLLGTMVGILAVLVLSRSPRLVLRVAVIGTAAALAFCVAVPWLPERLAAAVSIDKNMLRLHFWRISWEAFVAHPILGVGAGHLQQHLQPYADAGLIDNALQAHSLYLQELAEGGVLGVLLVVGMHVYFIRKYVRAFLGTEDPLLRAVTLGVALGFVSLLVAGVFEHTFGAAIVGIYSSFLLGVAEASRRGAVGAEDAPALASEPLNRGPRPL